MRSIFTYFLISFLGLVCFGQRQIPLDITSTVHLLFESKVLKADVGSGQYTDANGNVVSDISTKFSDVRLKLAPNIERFEKTNLFVETAKAYYSFMLVYDEGPKQYVIPISINNAISQKKAIKDEYGSTAATVPGHASTPKVKSPVKVPKKKESVPALAEKIAKKSGSVIAGVSSQKVNFWIDGIYVSSKTDKLFFRVNVKNRGNISYDWGYTGYFIRNKGNKTLKNEAVQEEEIVPTYTYNNSIDEVPGKEMIKKVYVFDKFTIAEKKILSVEFWENEGDRKVIFELKSKDLLKAESI